MSRYQTPDAKPSSGQLRVATVTQLGGLVQGQVLVTIQNNDPSVSIQVIPWMGASPPAVSDVTANGLLLLAGGSNQWRVEVGGVGDGTVRPRFYGVSLVSDQSAANTQVSETRT